MNLRDKNSAVEDDADVIEKDGAEALNPANDDAAAEITEPPSGEDPLGDQAMAELAEHIEAHTEAVQTNTDSVGITQPAPNVSDAKGDALERVEPEDIGVSNNVIQRAKALTSFSLMAYPGGKDVVADHHRNREIYAQPTRESYQLDCDRLKENLERLNANLSPEHHYKAEIFRAESEQAVVFHNDQEIIVAFEGSDKEDPKHWFRNFVKSPISYQKHAFFRDDLRNGKLDDYERKVSDLADRMYKPDADTSPQKAKEIRKQIVDDIKKAKVHGGWWDTIHLPLKFGPDMKENDTLWSAVERYMNTVQDTMPGKANVVFTGHSSGGAISTIGAALWMQNHDPVREIYTFGQPRVGNIPFRETLYKIMARGKFDGKSIAPIYRFEMLGDPIPCLPPLWSMSSFANDIGQKLNFEPLKQFKADHLVHMGNWIPIAPNGNLVGLRHDGRLISAAEAAQQKTKAMTTLIYVDPQAKTFFDKLASAFARFMQAPQDQVQQMIRSTDSLFDNSPATASLVYATPRHTEENWRQFGGDHVLKDKTFSSLGKTLFNFAWHVTGRSNYRHILPTMRDSLNRQLRMQDLKAEQGGALDSHMMAQHLGIVANAIQASKEQGELDGLQDIDMIIGLIEKDCQFFLDSVEDSLRRRSGSGAGEKKKEGQSLSDDMILAGRKLAIARGPAHLPIKDWRAPGSLNQLIYAIDDKIASEPGRDHPELDLLRETIRKERSQMEYFLAANAEISLDKNGVRYHKIRGNDSGAISAIQRSESTQAAR